MQIRIAAVLGVLLTVSGCRVIEPAPPPSAPRIDSFTASKTRTAPGEEVTLSFTATGATQIELSDDSGNAVQLDGSAEAGTAKIAPSRTSFYVLRATGAGGRDSSFVQIAVNEPLKDLFLIAVPATINSGEQGQLLWGAPGASTVTLKYGTALVMPLTGTTGTVTVTPANSEQYTLTAQGAPGTPPLTAVAGLEVRPVLASADLAAIDGIEAGKTLTFSWRTLGAARVTISERTFGLLATIDESSSVAMGTHDYVLPATLPSGVAVTEGLPLHFTVSAIAGNTVISKSIDRVVGLRPLIEMMDAPDNVTAGRRFTVKWKTTNANAISIQVNGLPLFNTLTGEQARVDLGSASLPAPAAQTDYTFIASSAHGAVITRTFTVRPVPLPTIDTFTLTGAFNNVGEDVTARWTTHDANRVLVRIQQGPTLATITASSQVASGNVVITPANATAVTLEAYNPAGDFVELSHFVAFNGTPAVSVTPTPVLRNAQATLSWTLTPASVLEVVGLPTATPAPMNNSANFIDLNTVVTAEPLFFADTDDGAQQLPALPGFRFPLLGKVQDAIWVSVNGFISFTQPAALNTNSDLIDAGTTDAGQSMIAPLWDNLVLGTDSKVLYAVRTSTSGENLLVVQWDKVQLVGNSTSELTFQAQLFETGQVTFVYKTVTPPVTSATIGIKDTIFPAAQQFAFNSTTTQPVADLELNYFTGGPADGTVPFKAGSAKRLDFFGRTATGRIPARAQVRSFAVGEVTVNEVMAFPEASVASTGQWIELRNRTTGAIDLEGLRVDTLLSGDAGFVIPAGSVIDAGAVFVLGQSTDPVENGGATVHLAAPTLTTGPSGRVRVSLGTTVLSTFSYAADAGVVGTSLQATGDDVMFSDGGTIFSCPGRMQTFGFAGAIGTPGAPNESCAAYSVSSIPGRFTPAPAGTEVLTTITDDDDVGSLTLPQPFTYFGVPTTNAQLSTNGFVSLGVAPLGVLNGVNQITVGTTSPNGVVAPFWDDLRRDANGKNAMWRDTDRTILSWEGFSIFGMESSNELNFQVHLLDNGVIEFHYGQLSSSSVDPIISALAGGSSATVWLEKQDGTFAVISSIERPDSIAPNSGIRFTPRP